MIREDSRERRFGRTVGVLLSVAALCAAACGSPPSQNSSGLSGGEHLAWEQPVASVNDLPRYRFAAYVDSVRVELPDASCNVPTNGIALCTTKLPPMSPGKHVLQVVTYTVPERVDSPKGPPIEVTVGK
jgi:hypothetical protein